MRRTPLEDCFALSWRDFLIYLRIAVLFSQSEAFQKCLPCCLAGFRWRKVNMQPQVIRFGV
jgi:hypothetical protein